MPAFELPDWLSEVEPEPLTLGASPPEVDVPAEDSPIAASGESMIDAEGQPFYGPEEDAALFQVLRDEIDPTKAELIEMDAHVNDDEFAIAAAQKLIDLINQ